MTLEREIYSIETANINKETLDAMKNAGTAMKQIHAGLTIDKVDDVMYASTPPPLHLQLSMQSIWLTTRLQGRSARTARDRRRNQRSDHLRRHNWRHRRR
jgi:hypothetical protein